MKKKNRKKYENQTIKAVFKLFTGTFLKNPENEYYRHTAIAKILFNAMDLEIYKLVRNHFCQIANIREDSDMLTLLEKTALLPTCVLK